eukprot:5647474-Prorocentrum_lima.AAC.1
MAVSSADPPCGTGLAPQTRKPSKLLTRPTPTTGSSCGQSAKGMSWQRFPPLGSLGQRSRLLPALWATMFHHKSTPSRSLPPLA